MTTLSCSKEWSHGRELTVVVNLWKAGMCGLIKDVKERVNAKYKSNFVFQNNFTVGSYKFTWEKHVASSGLSSRTGGRDFPWLLWAWALATLIKGNKKKMEPKELPSQSIHRLLTAYTGQLEIFVTALLMIILREIHVFNYNSLIGSHVETSKRSKTKTKVTR